MRRRMCPRRTFWISSSSAFLLLRRNRLSFVVLNRANVPTTTGRLDIFIDASELSAYGQNAHTLSHGMTSWLVFLADSPLATDLGPKPARLFKAFRKTLTTRDIREVSVYFAGLADRLLDSLPSLMGSTPIFLEEFKTTPVFREYHVFFKTQNSDVLRFLLSFLWFSKRFAYKDPELESVAFRNWLELETQMSQRQGFDTDITDPLSNILRTLAASYDNHTTLPVHGGGAVSERGIHGVKAKNDAMSFDFNMYRYIQRRISRTESVPWLPRHDMDWRTGRVSPPLCARLAFVPKDLKKARSICMEPAAYMWAQQDVRVHFERSISDSIFGQFIDIHDQSKNRFGALLGSIDGTLDTIDLSSASDSVAWDLITEVFPLKILVDLGLTRSRYVELPDGRIHRAHKFAPMGSALCFPVQSTLYAAIVILAAYRLIAQQWERDLNSVMARVPVRKLFSGRDPDPFWFYPFHVYGDDIVCDSRLTSIVIDLLTSLGFTVNSEKSFRGDHPFRESCGGFYYRGQDVTPYRYKVKFLEPKASATALVSLVLAANRAGDYGYKNLHGFLVRSSLHYPIEGYKGRINPILFSNDPDEGLSLFSLNPRNLHLHRRYYDATADQTESTCSRYQRDEIKSFGLKAADTVITDEDQYYYVQWQRSCFVGGGDNGDRQGPHTTNRETSGTRLRWRWTPA